MKILSLHALPPPTIIIIIIMSFFCWIMHRRSSTSSSIFTSSFMLRPSTTTTRTAKTRTKANNGRNYHNHNHPYHRRLSAARKTTTKTTTTKTTALAAAVTTWSMMIQPLTLISSVTSLSLSTTTTNSSNNNNNPILHVPPKVATTTTTTTISRTNSVRLWGTTTTTEDDNNDDNNDDNGNEENNKNNNNNNNKNIIKFLSSDDVKLSTILKFRGNVDQGYGRGGKKLGIPTANLPSSLFSNALEDIPTGVYFGWATIELFNKELEEDQQQHQQQQQDSDDSDNNKNNNNNNNNNNCFVPYKAVVNVGYSPTFEGSENPEKIIEAHLIVDDENDDDENGNENNNVVEFLEDFYGIPMRLLLCGFLRPEQKFDNFNDLIKQIHTDIAYTKIALTQIPYYQQFQYDDDFLFTFTTSTTRKQTKKENWIGNSGGNDDASWEYVSAPPSNMDDDDDDDDDDNNMKKKEEFIKMQQSVSSETSSSSSSSSSDESTTTTTATATATTDSSGLLTSSSTSSDEKELLFLKHQQEVFDKLSTQFFNDRTKEVTPDLEPTYQAMVDDMLAQILWNSKQRLLDVSKDKDDDDDNDDDEINIPTTLRILDVACGTGVLWEFLLRGSTTNQKLQITGVDLSSRMVDLARDKIKLLRQQQQQQQQQDNDDTVVDISVVQSDILAYCQQEQQKSNDDDDSSDDSAIFFDGILVNACFGNFYNPREVLKVLCEMNNNDDNASSTTTTTTTATMMICISHPLGSSFVKKLHNESPETVPHTLPETILEATKLIHGLPCVTSTLHCIPPGDGTTTTSTKTGSSGNYYLWTIKKCRAKGLNKILRFRGTVDQGYGRGGKKLGVPTANLPASQFQNALEDVDTGVYFGWAVLEREDDSSSDDDSNNKIYKAVVNVGYSPTFEGQENPEKIIEAHLILEEDDDGNKVEASSSSSSEESSILLPDFYDVPMKLQLIGFLRPEKKFDSFPNLIAQIHADIQDAKDSLEDIPYKQLQNDNFLTATTTTTWVGTSGGNEQASWEFVPMMDVLSNVLAD